ncbi:MAG: hypothetical protein ACYC4D_02950 [Thermoleophilia bacterium]
MLEALFLTILATLALAAMFGFQQRSFSLDTGRSAINYGINPGTEPVQNETSWYQTIVDVPGGSATLSSNASFTINAKVEGSKAYDDAISDLVPYDLLLTWGDMANDEIDSKLVWEQGDRRGQVSGSLGGASGVELSTDYVIRHVSNNHMIPSTERIERAMRNIKAGDLVRIDGRLVDVRMSLDDGRVFTVNTSKTRTDQGEGACEIIYVEHLRVNGQTY